MEYFTTEQVAKRYGVQTQTVRRWCKIGLFPNIRLGAKIGRGAIYRVPASDLNGFVPPRLGRPVAAVPSAAALAQHQSRQRRRKAQADKLASSSRPAKDQTG